MTLEDAVSVKLRYPKLRPQIPVLRRADGEVQVGIDPETALIFSEPKLVSVLLALNGAHQLRDVRDVGAAAGLRADEVDEALRILDDAGMLLEGWRGSKSQDPQGRESVRMIGAGPLGTAMARLLAQSRIGRLWLVDTQPSEASHRPPGGTRATRVEALCASLTDEFNLPVATATHWSRSSPAEIDLTVITSDAAEVDRLVAEDLVGLDQPHLVVRSAGDLVTVGPLVIPGRTACLRCTDLRRRDSDPAWPVLLDQLTRLRLPVPAALSSWTAAVAVTQALAFLRGRTPEACGSTLELSQHDLVTRWRTWTAHPGCGCHWLSAGQWSA